MQTQNRLKIALQKKGRLSQDCAVLLKQCGVKINWNEQRLIAYSENLPIEILRVRDDDIPGLIFDGVVDLGIIGENVLEEEESLVAWQLTKPSPTKTTPIRLRRLSPFPRHGP